MTPITSFEKHMRIVFGLAFSVLLSTIVVSVFIINKLNDSLEWVAHTHEVVAGINAVHLQYTVSRTSSKNYLLTYQPKHIAIRELAIAEFESAVSKLKALTADNPAQQARINEMRTLARKYFTDSGRLLSESQTSPPDKKAMIEWVDKTMSESMDVVSSLQQMRDEESRLLVRRQHDSRDVVNQAYNIMPFMLLVQALITAYIYYGVLHQCKAQ